MNPNLPAVRGASPVGASSPGSRAQLRGLGEPGAAGTGCCLVGFVQGSPKRVLCGGILSTKSSKEHPPVGALVWFMYLKNLQTAPNLRGTGPFEIMRLCE